MSDIDLSGVVWRKSRRSAVNGNCVEVARLPGQRFAVRDSKDRTGPVLIFEGSGWAAFVAWVKGGDFDL
ncbi:hypothetical protein FHR32_003226 [Streptosporangium album]|uniref:DUF397 domain-containing protein n=1 Tax=Streptosporangium album TaxID=47479 RepID=A0A7W7RWX7_9ACTN|nr:DUF397 domain-containing protein [Streptosporangium album]MBB4938921.1 hypothetical protein [Streptosporangium album]